MIFKIERFKCFSSIDVPLNKLTILCGANAVGKSTIVQALLMYRACMTSISQKNISINNKIGLSLGNADDVIYQNNNSEFSDVIKIGFFDENIECVNEEKSLSNAVDLLELEVSDESKSQRVLSRRLKIKKRPKSRMLKSRESFYFNYLSAERNGPKVAQEYFSEEERTESIGTKGEFTAEVLLNNERKKIRSGLVYAFDKKIKGSDKLLLQAVQAWMSLIVGAIEIRVSENGNSPPSIYLKRPGIHGEWNISTNTGFGISYTLPIVVAGLLTPRDGYLVVDSPEAHLHPAAQTALAKFLAWVASADVNVIVETHSDHIIDGIRLATVTPASRLNASDCNILNVYRNKENSTIELLKIENNGRLSRWPAGFFDQQTTNLRDIADAARK